MVCAICIGLCLTWLCFLFFFVLFLFFLCLRGEEGGREAKKRRRTQFAMLRFAMLCFSVPCHAALCNSPCYSVLCCVILCIASSYQCPYSRASQSEKVKKKKDYLSKWKLKNNEKKRNRCRKTELCFSFFTFFFCWKKIIL